MRAEFEAWYSALIGNTANLFRCDAYYGHPRYGDAKTDIAWLAWQASRKQALEEAVEAAANAVCDCCFNEEQLAAAQEVIEAIRAMAGSDKRSIPGLLKQESAASAPVPVTRGNVDQLVAPAAVRADEVNAEVVDARLDGVKGDLGAATDADPHGCHPEREDLQDRQSVQGIQAAFAEKGNHRF